MNIDVVIEKLKELAMLKYFPANNPSVLVALSRLVGEMCRNESEVEWLVNRMTSGLYTEWPGPKEMRACFCSKFPPKDGINAYSEVYLDGIPSERERNLLGAPNLRLLGEGSCEMAQNSGMAVESAAVTIAVEVIEEIRNRRFCEPATEEEISSAPEWLRRLEGYE